MLLKENVLGIDSLSLPYFTPMKYLQSTIPSLPSQFLCLSGERSYEQRKVPEIIPIRMANGSRITKASWKGNLKH